ncbi:MAG: bifunctional adenosylcobinamide kinase/adenosylcobinamide-phosphate guanylyltransferase [Acuticoccus sp.]
MAARSGQIVTYVATAGPPRDDEMAARIAAHKARRPAKWRTLDAPLALADAVRPVEGVVLLDCLTLWLTNIMLDERDIAGETDALVAALARRAGPTVAVANEVGEGIVPGTPLGRRFRDWQGVLNQRVAEAATDVVKLVAGCPLVIKPRSDPEPTL